jgi:hypothetical protein
MTERLGIYLSQDLDAEGMDILAPAVAFVYPIIALSLHKSCHDGNIKAVYN